MTGKGSGTGAQESKSISKELASTINDGLFFYEQVEESVVLLIMFIVSFLFYIHQSYCLRFLYLSYISRN